MSGGWMWLSQWVKKIDRKREERAEQRESSKRKQRHQARRPKLRNIRLTAAEKQELLDKIVERPLKTVASSKMKIAIYLYMAVMILGVVGTAIMLFIYQDVAYPAGSVENMLSCLIAIAFCVLWLKLSSIRKSRGLLATIPGIILFISGSGLISFGLVPPRPESVTVPLLLGVPALAAGYFLCFRLF